MAIASLLLSSVTPFTIKGPCFIVSRRLSTSASARTILDAPTPSNTSNDDGRDWQYVLHLAEDAARRAGEIMKSTTGRIASLDQKSNVRDLVTESDIACQQVIFSTINAVRPNDVFLGEESVNSGSEASINALRQALKSNGGDNDRLLWIVDPIDGTTVSKEKSASNVLNDE